MTDARAGESPQQKPLRLWPGVTLVVVQWLLWQVVPAVAPGSTSGMISAFGGLLGGVAVLVWWVFFSRASRFERWGGAVLLVVAPVAMRPILHESIVRGGMGFIHPVYATPILCLALVLWAALSRGLSSRLRRATLIATILLAAGGWVFVRNEGVSAKGTHFAWRWAATAEERLLAEGDDLPAVPRAAVVAPAAIEDRADWPGFRGPRRDGVVRHVRIGTDWAASPPAELWRRPIGPGWSSFAVHGDLLYTLEQRGEDEAVSCHDATTGEPVWRHLVEARFWEPEGGAGPRGTPALQDGRVYAFGATGILSALDAVDGSVAWSRDVASDSDKEAPYWGFSSSPLVVDDLVLVAAAGKLVGYEIATGEPRWVGPDGGVSYSSPHRVTIGGVEQVVLLSESGATGFAPADGTVLWQHEWPGFSIVQPAVTPDGDLLLGADQVGTTRVKIAQSGGEWTTEERWTSNRLKSNFNDFVVHDGHAYGFDGSILASIDIESGERNWKGGRYGQGQLILLPDQDVLLVITEQGELVLVSATPDRFTELTRSPGLEGKTWNHPVLVGDRLFVRNGEEMAAFRLQVQG